MPGGKETEQIEARDTDPRILVDQGIEQLMRSLQDHTSQRLMDYLAFTARFHSYSLSNQLLIYMQRPQATYVAGYQTWKEMGYQVKGGEKGIRILAPLPYRHINKKTAEEEERLTFIVVSVFDASQLANLDGKPLPTFFQPQPDDQKELYEKVAQAVKDDGISLVEGWTGPAQGYSAGKRIVLQTGMDSRNRVVTLFHEYAHELLHWNGELKKLSHETRECHAEAVAFVVAHRFGINNEYSADYLKHWGTAPQTLRGELEIVRKAASYIIDRIEKPK